MIQNFDSDKFDYISNFQVTEENGILVYRSTYPSGTEVEIMSLETLEKAWNEATTLDEKEHVTPYVYLNPNKFKIKILDLEQDLSGYRWSLDYENDLKVIREIIKNIQNRPIITKDIIEFLKKNPNIVEMNKNNI